MKGVPATNTLPWRDERRILAIRVKKLVHENQFRAAILWNGTEFLSRQLSSFPPALADRIDCEALQAWRSRHHRDDLRQKLRDLRRGIELAVYEASVLRSLEGLVVTGEDDARTLRLLTANRHVCVIPNGVELPLLEELPNESDRPSVIFTGVLSYRPNISAVRYFAQEVWPEVHRRVPEARFVVAGRSPVTKVRELDEEPGITIHPDVTDLTDEIRRAWLAVAPMQSGSGIKNKVLEAWAAGRPVVLTELATNGLALDEAPPAIRDLVIRDAGTMAQTIVDLLEDAERRHQLGIQSRRLAEERHSWSVAGRRLVRFMDKVLPGGTVAYPADNDSPPYREPGRM